MFTEPRMIGTQIETFDDDELKDNTLLARIAVPRPIEVAHEVGVRTPTKNGVAIPDTSKTPRAHLGMTVESVRDVVHEAAERLRHHLP